METVKKAMKSQKENNGKTKCGQGSVATGIFVRPQGWGWGVHMVPSF